MWLSLTRPLSSPPNVAIPELLRPSAPAGTLSATPFVGVYSRASLESSRLGGLFALCAISWEESKELRDNFRADCVGFDGLGVDGVEVEAVGVRGPRVISGEVRDDKAALGVLVGVLVPVG